MQFPVRQKRGQEVGALAIREGGDVPRAGLGRGPVQRRRVPVIGSGRVVDARLGLGAALALAHAQETSRYSLAPRKCL